MEPKTLCRPEKVLRPTHLIYPLCLALVAMSAMPRAFSALDYHRDLKRNVELSPRSEPGAVELLAEEGLEPQSCDESLCPMENELE